MLEHTGEAALEVVKVSTAILFPTSPLLPCCPLVSTSSTPPSYSISSPSYPPSPSPHPLRRPPSTPSPSLSPSRDKSTNWPTTRRT